MFGKDAKKKELIKNLGQIYEQIQREHQISPGDFPDIKKMQVWYAATNYAITLFPLTDVAFFNQEQLVHHDFTKFPPLKPRLLEAVDRMLAEDIARLMAVIPQESVIRAAAEPNGSAIKGGAFEGVQDKVSPFGYLKGEGIDAGAGEPEWIVAKDRYKSDNIFDSLNPIDGKVTGAGRS